MNFLNRTVPVPVCISIFIILAHLGWVAGGFHG
jgi:hypothetical protein